MKEYNVNSEIVRALEDIKNTAIQEKNCTDDEMAEFSVIRNAMATFTMYRQGQKTLEECKEDIDGYIDTFFKE